MSVRFANAAIIANKNNFFCDIPADSNNKLNPCYTMFLIIFTINLQRVYTIYIKYRVALHFCGSLILRMGDFSCISTIIGHRTT